MDVKGWGKSDSKKVKVSDKHFVAVSPISILSFLNGVAAYMDAWLKITFPRFPCS